MKKLLLFMLIVASLNAEKITDADIEAINQLAPKILEKSAKENKIENISKIFAIIWQNRKIEIKPILERIQISLVGGSGMKNRLRDIDYSGDLKPYQYIGAEFSIAILDEKERREKQTEIIKQKAEILKILQDYYNLKTKIAHKQNELDILTLKEKRLKARVLQGVSNLDDRLDNLDSIRKAKEQKELDEVKATMLFFSILELVQEPAQKILKELL